MNTKLLVGNTRLFRIQELSQYFGCENLLIKDESENPTGTFKDRRSEVIIKKAVKDGVNKLVLITSGNAGFSLAQFAKGTGIKIVCVVDKHLSKPTLKKLEDVCDKVIAVDLNKRELTSKDIIELARNDRKEVIRDVSNGYHDAYISIIKEIKKEKPDFLICPLGGGEAFVGLYNGLKKEKMRISLIGVGPYKNPSLADKLCTRFTPYISKTASIVKEGKGEIFRVSEEKIAKNFNYCKKYIECEPSSAIVFLALNKIKNRKDKKIVVINSGRGLI